MGTGGGGGGGEYGNHADDRAGGSSRARGNGFIDRRYTDVRIDGYDGSNAASSAGGNVRLEDYIVVKGKKGGKKGRGGDIDDGGVVPGEGETGMEREDGEALGQETSVCPVCGEFEGDEAAVSHHVNGHFE